jgi:alkanesulfonate monooxygenase SsuD/methylene tetrahydromethanopterin reductase-like flavin-dependent oxidoreductase (luciferase family)
MEGENDPATSAPSAQPTLSGSPQALAEALGEYAAAGVDEVIVPDWNLGPIDSRLRIYDRFFNEAAAEVH